MQNKMYVNKDNELSVVNRMHLESITMENCHLVVDYLLKTNPELMEAIVNEYEAQIRFKDK